MKKTTERFRRAIIDIAPMMEEANVNMVLNSINDTSCMALMPQTEDRNERLEEIMPMRKTCPVVAMWRHRLKNWMTEHQNKENCSPNYSTSWKLPMTPWQKQAAH